MPSNRGYTGAANIAIRDFWDRHQGAEYFLIGSHDLHVKPDCLSMLVEMANKNRRLGVVAPVLIGPGNPSSGESYGMSGSLPHPIVHGSQVVRRDWASGTCLMFRRHCLDDVGFFDERFGSYGEDVDICLRAGDAGWQVGVVSDAVAWGLGSASLPALSRMEANSVLLASKRYGVWGAARALGVLVTWTGRSAAGSIAPWRNSSARQESRTYLRRHVEAIRQVPWRAAIQEMVSAPGGVAKSA